MKNTRVLFLTAGVLLLMCFNPLQASSKPLATLVELGYLVYSVQINATGYAFSRKQVW